MAADVAPGREAGAPVYGFPAGLWRRLERSRPPGPLTRPGLFRSPVRGPWLTSLLGAVLLAGLPVMIATGLLSYAAYEPRFAGNSFPRDVGWLRLPHFAWPTSPAWLYRLNQGLHVSLGLILVPIVLTKLWSVLPKLFAWPPARSIAAVLERLSLLLLVGSILFELATGILNIQYWYVFRFDFYTAHYFGAWVFIGAFASHVTLKLPTMTRSLRSRSLTTELRTPLSRTQQEPIDPDSPDAHGLISPDPAPASISRRGILALAGSGSAALTAVSLGQTLGWRPTALLSVRGQSYGTGPTDFQINRTAAAAQITPDDTGTTWRLHLTGGQTDLLLTRQQLLAMPQHTARLPIACVEGWSSTQTWTGVRLADLVALTGLTRPSRGIIRSLEKTGAFATATLNTDQLTTRHALLAFKVNGTDLTPDHGYPARIIIPAAPGVHNTKWVSQIELHP